MKQWKQPRLIISILKDKNSFYFSLILANTESLRQGKLEQTGVVDA